MNIKKTILQTLVLGTGVSTSILFTSFNSKLVHEPLNQSNTSSRCYETGGSISVYDLKCSTCGYSSFKASTAARCTIPTVPPIPPVVPASNDI